MRMNQTVFEALAAALEMEPGSREARRTIRRAYVNPSQPLGPEEDAVFYALAPEPAVPVWTETENEAGQARFFRFAPYRLQLIFYGPRAEELAWGVYHRLFLDGPGQARRILRKQGMYPLPQPDGPVLVWEEWEKEHRPRVDLTVFLRVRAGDEAGMGGTVEAPPETEIFVSGRGRTGSSDPGH